MIWQSDANYDEVFAEGDGVVAFLSCSSWAADKMNKGVAVIYNTDINDEFDVERKIRMIAVCNDKNHVMLFADFSEGLGVINRRTIGCEVYDLDECTWADEFGNADVST